MTADSTALTRLTKKIEKDVVRELQEKKDYLSPQQADQYLNLLAAMFSQLSELLGELEIREAEQMVELIEQHGSVSRAELYFKATDDGKEKIRAKHKLKGIEKLLSALRGRLQRFHDESYNQY